MTTATRRKLDLRKVVLDSGSHSPDGQFCVMEAVAYVAGEKWTDRPECVAAPIGAFLRSWNDTLPDADRQKLKPYIRKVIGTNTGAADDEVRAWMATDWLVRTFTPEWLDLAGLTDHAAKLRALPALTTTELAGAAMDTIRAARKEADAARAAAGDAAWDAAGAAAWAAARAAAWDAAWDAAGAAARAAAWDAARAAARAAAWDAAWDAAGAAARAAAWDAAGAAAWAAARAAAWDAAGAAARAAAWDAAGAAAGDAAGAAARAAAWAAARAAAGAAAGAALAPTVEKLQGSAFDLLDRMIAVGKS